MNHVFVQNTELFCGFSNRPPVGASGFLITFPFIKPFHSPLGFSSSFKCRWRRQTKKVLKESQTMTVREAQDKATEQAHRILQ